MSVNPADLAKLSVEEKLELISDLWDSIEASKLAPPLSESQSEELARRRSEGLNDPLFDDRLVRAVRNELHRKP